MWVLLLCRFILVSFWRLYLLYCIGWMFTHTCRDPHNMGNSFPATKWAWGNWGNEWVGYEPHITNRPITTMESQIIKENPIYRLNFLSLSKKNYILNRIHGSKYYPFVFACGSRWYRGQIRPHCSCRWALSRNQIWKNIPTICKGSTCRLLARWENWLFSFRVSVSSGSKFAPIQSDRCGQKLTHAKT